MILPRMLALAETGWSGESQKNYSSFAETALPVHLGRFDRLGLNYLVPTAFNYTDTVLRGTEFVFKLKPPLPGAKIYYTLNNRFPGDFDHLYTEPIHISLEAGKKITLKTIVVSPAGRRSVVTRTVLQNEANEKGPEPK